MKRRIERRRRRYRNGQVGADARRGSADALAGRLGERVEGRSRLGPRCGEANRRYSDAPGVRVVGVAVRVGLHLHAIVRPDLLFSGRTNVTHELRVPRAAACVAQNVERDLHRHGVAAGMRRTLRFPVGRVAGVLRRVLIVRTVGRRIKLIEVAADAVGPEIDPDFVVAPLADVVGMLDGHDRLVLHRIETHVQVAAVGRNPRFGRFARGPRANGIPRKVERGRLRPSGRRRVRVERRIGDLRNHNDAPARRRAKCRLPPRTRGRNQGDEARASRKNGTVQIGAAAAAQRRGVDGPAVVPVTGKSARRASWRRGDRRRANPRSRHGPVVL